MGHVDWTFPGTYIPCLFAAGVITALELYFVGIGTQLRQTYNAVVVRALYVTYFILLGFLIHWSPQNGFGTVGGAKVSFTYHPLFMSTAWVFCATEAAMAFRSPISISRSSKKLYHAAMNFASFAFSISGIAIMYANHQQKGVAHMNSQHSWVGIMTATCMVTQYALGYYAFYMSNNNSWKRRVLPVHKFFGAATYVSALATICLGLSLSYGIRSSEGAYGSSHRVNQTAVIIIWCIGIRVLAGFGGVQDSSDPSVNREKQGLLASETYN